MKIILKSVCNVYKKKTNGIIGVFPCISSVFQTNKRILDSFSINVFNCNDCKLKIGRDSNAAKNIMLRYFTKRAIIS
jgi:hypothetical protein